MLSDELDSKPELLVQFVQNASIPLVQSLEDSESKHSCLPLLAPAESSLCTPLELTDGGLSHDPDTSPSLPEFGGLPHQSPLVVRSHPQPQASPSPPAILHDLQQPDSTSYVLLNLAKGITASSESLIFAADGAGDDEDEGVSSGEYGLDGTAPWYLRVQELAHDSLIAATRAQLARDAKASQDARAATVSNGDHTHSLVEDGDKREPPPRASRPLSKQVLRCSFEGCGRTFTWPAHLKYHLKTHRNDRMFQCSAEGCGKSFYVLQRLQVHMRTHNGEKPFICKEKNCGKKFTTAGNLKNHRRIHTGEKPFLCEADGCGRSFAEYSSLRKHSLVHSGEKPHVCAICGKTFSQSGSRNVHMRKRHGEEGLSGDGRETGEALTQSSLLEADGENGGGLVTMTTAVEPMNLHHVMLRSPGSADSVVVLSQPHELVTMTTEGHAYGEDVVALL
ncbi:zinc finger protein 410 isoform X1 [Fundulus heteroclitus]|uniref:zinc finger protein 410 isoform X1 n=1 Tax=Fundulus heteroclitus TaxID=8078 RepID=UPI00165C25AF|nr:zinc finger protein 410 isoform X1 [Fundulus heteroclitus]XP_012722121.2 zinc finger protein 410 isoform X1 [Fundulus heteroclitus]